MPELNAKTTALVVIDLQEGILPFAGGPLGAPLGWRRSFVQAAHR